MIQHWSGWQNAVTAGIPLPFSSETSIGGGFETGPGLALAAGTARNLRIDLGTAPGVGTSRTFTLEVEGANTPLAVTISGTAKTATVSIDIAIAKYNTIRLVTTASGSPAVSSVSYSLEFESDTSVVSIYGGCQTFAPSVIGTVGYQNPLFPFNTPWQVLSTFSQFKCLIGANGSITELGGLYQIALTGTNAYELYLWKSTDGGTTFVKQDGTGGTIDTRVVMNSSSPTVASGATYNAASFNLPVVIGDMITCSCVATAGSSLGFRMAPAIRFEATTPTQFMICGSGQGPGDADLYSPLERPVWSTTESDSVMVVGPLSTGRLIIEGITWRIVTAPGGGATRTLRLRRNASDTTVTATISTGLFASGGGSVGFVDGDTVDLKSSTTNTPVTNADIYWALRGAATATWSSTPNINLSEPCCPCDCPAEPGSGGSSSSGPLDTHTGDILPPNEPGDWIAACTGGGDVPTAVDPTDAEVWAA